MQNAPVPLATPKPTQRACRRLPQRRALRSSFGLLPRCALQRHPELPWVRTYNIFFWRHVRGSTFRPSRISRPDFGPTHRPQKETDRVCQYVRRVARLEGSCPVRGRAAHWTGRPRVAISGSRSRHERSPTVEPVLASQSAAHWPSPRNRNYHRARPAARIGRVLVSSN
jgi:hypothetical protein